VRVLYGLRPARSSGTPADASRSGQWPPVWRSDRVIVGWLSGDSSYGYPTTTRGQGSRLINGPSHWGEAAWLQVAALIVIVVNLQVPPGNYLARTYTAALSWRVEKAIYRVVGIQPGNEQRWTSYPSSLLAFSLVSVLLLDAILGGKRICQNPGVIRE
jgi:hypothetical protein